MIIIRNTTHTDAGNYRVEIASLDFDNPVCDSLWLPLLRNFAAHAPVTFTLTLMTESHVQCMASIMHDSCFKWIILLIFYNRLL